MVSSGARDSSGGHGGELIGGNGFGQVKCGGYGTKRREKKEGIRAGAHRGAQERLGEQREQQTAPESPELSRWPKEEGEVDALVVGPPSSNGWHRTA